MKHFIEIENHPPILEHIDALFDNITNLMTPNSVMYGGVINALLSGIMEYGDLDISVSRSEYDDIVKALNSSEKWLFVDGTATRTAPVKAKRGLRNPYEEIADFPVARTVSFKTINGATVQIIQAKTYTDDPLHDALDVVSLVDFAHCGIAVDRYGRMMEVVPHAYDSCLQRVIRVANYRANEDVENIRTRLEKYLNRGWSLSIAPDQIYENFRKAAKTAKEKVEPKQKTIHSPYFSIDHTRNVSTAFTA